MGRKGKVGGIMTPTPIAPSIWDPSWLLTWVVKSGFTDVPQTVFLLKMDNVFAVTP